MKFHIDVDPIGPRWRASCRVPKELGVRTGSATQDGPWIAGEGRTPEDAIRELFCAVGRAYLNSNGLVTATRCRLCGTRADALSVTTCPGCGGQDTHRDGCTEAQQEASEEKMAADEKIIVCKHCGHDIKGHTLRSGVLLGCFCRVCPGWERKE